MEPPNPLLPNRWPPLLAALLLLGACAGPPPDGREATEGGRGGLDASVDLDAGGSGEGGSPESGRRDAGLDSVAPGGTTCGFEPASGGAFRCAGGDDACGGEPSCCIASGRCCEELAARAVLDRASCPDGVASAGCALLPFGSPAPTLFPEEEEAIFVPGGGTRQGSGARWAAGPLRVGPEAHLLQLRFRGGACGEAGACLQQLGLLLVPRQGAEPPVAPRLEEAALALLVGGDGAALPVSFGTPLSDAPVAGGRGAGEPGDIELRLAPGGAVAWRPGATEAWRDLEVELPPGDYAVYLYGRALQDGPRPAILALHWKAAGCDAASGWEEGVRLGVPADRVDVAVAAGEVALARLADEGNRLLAIVERLERLEAGGLQRRASVQLGSPWRDVALVGGDGGWALWGLDAAGDLWRLEGASLEDLDGEMPERLGVPGEDAGWEATALAAVGAPGSELLVLLERDGVGGRLALVKRSEGTGGLERLGSASLAELGLPPSAVDVEVVAAGGLWRLWVVDEHGARSDLAAFVGRAELALPEETGSPWRGAVPTGARWVAAEAGGLRFDSPAAWVEEGAPPALHLLAVRFDGVARRLWAWRRPVPGTTGVLP